METELINQLNECIRICNKLESALVADGEEMRLAVSGAVQQEYARGIDGNIEAVKNLKNVLYGLLNDISF